MHPYNAARWESCYADKAKRNPGSPLNLYEVNPVGEAVNTAS